MKANGTFKTDLQRNFKQLKDSRAESVAEDVEIIYKRKIEDLCHEIRNIERDRENIMLDLSPTNVTSALAVPSDFDAAKFLEKDNQLGIRKREAEIKLDIVARRYEELFGVIADPSVITRVLPSWIPGTIDAE